MADQSVPRTSEIPVNRAEEEAKQIAAVIEMRKTVNNIIDNTKQLEIQSKGFNEAVSEPAPISVKATFDVDAPTLERLQAILRGHNAEHGTNLEQVKKELVEEFRRQFEGRIKDKIKQEVRDSLVSQIRVQVDQQIVEHIPIALKQQLAEAKAQLQEVKVALQNSKARTKNGLLEATDRNEPLAVVLTPAAEPKKSKLYPVDMCSLFAYDLGTAKALVGDYNLVDSDDFEENIKTFLTHIGVHMDCIPTMNSTKVPEAGN